VLNRQLFCLLLLCCRTSRSKHIELLVLRQDVAILRGQANRPEGCHANAGPFGRSAGCLVIRWRASPAVARVGRWSFVSRLSLRLNLRLPADDLNHARPGSDVGIYVAVIPGSAMDKQACWPHSSRYAPASGSKSGGDLPRPALSPDFAFRPDFASRPDVVLRPGPAFRPEPGVRSDRALRFELLPGGPAPEAVVVWLPTRWPSLVPPLGWPSP
jgi:hypothetical protein